MTNRDPWVAFFDQVARPSRLVLGKKFFHIWLIYTREGCVLVLHLFFFAKCHLWNTLVPIVCIHWLLLFFGRLDLSYLSIIIHSTCAVWPPALLRPEKIVIEHSCSMTVIYKNWPLLSNYAATNATGDKSALHFQRPLITYQSTAATISPEQDLAKCFSILTHC